MDLNINNPDQIKALIHILQNMLPKEEIEESKPNKIKTKTRSSKQEKSNNKFLDMPERNMHKSDSAIDKKLSINPPTPRTRKFEPITVKCRVCGKSEKVSPRMLADSDSDRYKCNKCSALAGG